MKWQGRLSGLRDIVLIVGIFALIIGVINLFTFTSAVKNKEGAQKVALMDLVEGEVGPGAYVKVTGVAFYGAYEATEDGVLTESYYWLADEKTGDVVVVKAEDPSYFVDEPERVSTEGMVRNLPSDLASLVREDQVEYPDLYLTDAVYIVEGQTPPSLEGSLVLMLLGLGGGIVCVVFYVVLPPYVFQRRAPAYDAQLTQERPPVKVTATLRKLKTLEPLTWSPKMQKFRNGVANLLAHQGSLMLYVHYVVKSRVYGVQVSKTETDWGLLLDHQNVVDMETGMLLGWKDRPALRIRYYDQNRKLKEALITFEDENGLFTGHYLVHDRLGFEVLTGEDY